MRAGAVFCSTHLRSGVGGTGIPATLAECGEIGIVGIEDLAELFEARRILVDVELAEGPGGGPLGQPHL